jgi:hypothetical protein
LADASAAFEVFQCFGITRIEAIPVPDIGPFFAVDDDDMPIASMLIVTLFTNDAPEGSEGIPVTVDWI